MAFAFRAPLVATNDSAAFASTLKLAVASTHATASRTCVRVKGVSGTGIEHAQARRIGWGQRSPKSAWINARDKSPHLRSQPTGSNSAYSSACAGGVTGGWAGTFAADIVVVVIARSSVCFLMPVYSTACQRIQFSCNRFVR